MSGPVSDVKAKVSEFRGAGSEFGFRTSPQELRELRTKFAGLLVSDGGKNLLKLGIRFATRLSGDPSKQKALNSALYEAIAGEKTYQELAAVEANILHRT